MSSSPWGDMSVQPQGQLIIFAMICVCKSFVYIFYPILPIMATSLGGFGLLSFKRMRGV
ncbi:MAG: hypothetical protein WCB31_07470 [Nitrososphaeraceae archaeon]